jgi:photosystem II stability/assembly factor-like uncharacterized protein
MKSYRTILSLFSIIQFTAQSTPSDIRNTLEKKVEFEQSSWFKNNAFENVGPTIMSGRVVDLAVNPSNPLEFYVAYASGGLWYTNNNGNSFVSVSETAPTQNCGALTVDWKSGTIWLGTGEVNSSRSSYAGIGLLKSTDNGKTWENLGLYDSHHISKIIVNPNDNNEIVVGVIGHLYTKNEERGLFKTTDGGKTWRKTLFVDDESGVIDVSIAPNNFKIQYASVWQRNRKAWHFEGSGKSSGIYKSTDGGNTWACVTNGGNGFPHDEGVGRIGVAVYDESTIYVVLDNQNKRPNKKQNNDPSKDANKAMVETDVIGAEVYKSLDGGISWVRTHDKFLDDLYYSYGYYFGNISIDIKNKDRVIIGGVPLLLSEDGGKTFLNIDKENVHADHHVTWINPSNPNHIINGNDGGVNVSFDSGKSWSKCNSLAVGQFYAINVDEQEPYNIYGGLQDNGVWVGPSDYSHNLEWQQGGRYQYEQLGGGDGMQVQIDRRNSNIVYAGSQHGYYVKIDRLKKKRTQITPKANKNDKPFRFNWQTPILLSHHNQDIVYFGSNFLHRSMNQGESWELISPDLTNGAKEGNVPYGTITTIAESQLKFGLIYTGSDDGLVYVTRDGGTNWDKISDSLPQNFWVSRVVASKHKKERVYVTLNGYRNDDFKSMIYVSEDYGKNWKSIVSNLPDSPVNVIIEDYKNENLLFVGTDNGLYVTLNRGLTWKDFSQGIPNVAVHDLKIQEKVNDLLVGTHGRSIYKINIENIQLLNDEVIKKEVHLFAVAPYQKQIYWGNSYSAWSKPFEPKLEISFFSKDKKKIVVEVFNSFSQKIFSKEIEATQGLNKVEYDLILSEDVVKEWKKKEPKLEFKTAKNGKIYLPISKNKIVINSLGNKYETNLLITKEDVR